MKQLAIETITKPMKLRGISKGIAELDGQRSKKGWDKGEVTYKKYKVVYLKILKIG